LIYEILQDELNNCGDVSLYSYSYILEDGAAEGDEELIIQFPQNITVL
jgi:hypothetical protein